MCPRLDALEAWDILGPAVRKREAITSGPALMYQYTIFMKTTPREFEMLFTVKRYAMGIITSYLSVPLSGLGQVLLCCL